MAWNHAGAYLGQLVTVRGPVVETRYDERGDGQPTFLDLGSAYPDEERLTVVIWGRDRPNFPAPPEQMYRGRLICVRGVVDTASGAPGIEVAQPSSITIE